MERKISSLNEMPRTSIPPMTIEGTVVSVVSCAIDLPIAPVMNTIKSISRLIFICLGFKFVQQS
jgi:hypothetical protein